MSFDRILATVKQSLREPDLVERSSSNAATIVDIQEVSVEEVTLCTPVHKFVPNLIHRYVLQFVQKFILF